MNRLHARGIDEDLHHRPGLGQIVDGVRVDLEGQVGLRPVIGSGLVAVGPQRRLHKVEEASENAVLIQALHGIERAVDPVADAGHAGAAPTVWRSGGVGIGIGIERRLEELDDCLGDLGIGKEGRLHIGLAERNRRLAEIFAVGAEHGDLAPVEPGRENQRVEAVVLDLAPPDADELGLEVFLHPVQIDRPTVPGLHAEIVQPDLPFGIRPNDPVADLADHPEAHVFQHRHDVGQRKLLVRMVDPEMHPRLIEAGGTVEIACDRVRAEHGLDLADVGQRVFGAVALAIAGRERILVEIVDLQPLGFPIGLRQFLAERVAPVPSGLGKAFLDCIAIEFEPPAGRSGNDELQPCMRLVGNLEVEHRDTDAETLFDDSPHRRPQLRGVTLPRHIDQAGYEPVECVAPGKQRDPLAAPDLENAERRFEEIRVRVLEQVAAGQGFDNLEQRRAAMAVGRESGTRDRRLGLAGKHGNVREALAMHDRREHADENTDARNPPSAAEPLDHHGVEMNRPVNRRPAVRLGDRNRLRLVAIGRGFRRGRAVLPAGEHAA